MAIGENVEADAERLGILARCNTHDDEDKVTRKKIKKTEMTEKKKPLHALMRSAILGPCIYVFFGCVCPPMIQYQTVRAKSCVYHIDSLSSS